MTLDDLIDRLEGVHESAGSFSARCPAHEDGRPSLSITKGDDGRILLYCFAGCTTDAICSGLGIAMADLFADSDHLSDDEWTPAGPASAVYSYTDEDGRLLFQVCRAANKEFRQRRPDPSSKSGWSWSLGDTRRVLYRLPRVIEAVASGATLFVVEGEKDVHAIEALGYTATCNPMGAGKWLADYAEHLKGADVVVVADKDVPGRQHARQVAATLADVAESVTVVEALAGKDVSDHLDAGHALEELQRVGGEVIPAEHSAEPAFFVDWKAFWEKDRREADWLFDDVLARGRGHAIFAGHKVGKSLLTLFIVMQLIEKGVEVIYLDYEMGEDDLYDRLAEMGYGPDSDLSRLHYALLPSLPPLDEPTGAKALFERVDAVQAASPGSHVALVIDTTARAVVGEENSADTVRAFYRNTGLGLKQRGVTWVRLDHAGKDPAKGQRGSSAKGDDVDIVWRLTRTPRRWCGTRARRQPDRGTAGRADGRSIRRFCGRRTATSGRWSGRTSCSLGGLLVLGGSKALA